MKRTDPEVPGRGPERSTLVRAAGEAIVLLSEQSRNAWPPEAVIAIMRQAGRLVDEGASARRTGMQCRVGGYRLAALLHMSDDPASQRLATELLECIGVGGPP